MKKRIFSASTLSRGLWMGLLIAICHSGCVIESMSLPDCHPLFPECGDEDSDGDGVINKDDDFPTDDRCAARDKENCTGCGQGCEENRWCSS